jgi:hypothetical protein
LNKSKPTHVEAKNEKKQQMLKLLQQLSKTDVARIHLWAENQKKMEFSHLQKELAGRASRAEQRKRSQASKANQQKQADLSSEAVARNNAHKNRIKQEKLAKDKRKIVM